MKEKRPEVYVDMDGVLADFFAEYAKLAGIKSGNYRDIPPAKTDPTLNKMIGTDFFARLPKFPSADQLIKMVTKRYGSYHICSSPLRGDHENSEEQKKIWIKQHLSPQPASIIITPNKAKYAIQKDGTPNILIDDRGSNITAWESAGGIGIKYQADEDGLEKIVDGLARARKIMRGELEHEPQKLNSLHRGTGTVVAKSGHNDDHNDEVAEADDINPRFQQSPIMAKESASVGATSAGSVASTSAQGGGWLFGGTVGAPKQKKKTKSRIIKR
jgi:5'(3')-deoxyribonucleotidase